MPIAPADAHGPPLVPAAVPVDDEGRDRFMDAVRAGGVLIVVAAHWLVLIPTVSEGAVGGTILYNIDPAFWPLTWIFDVLPLFFFVGGFANYTSYTSIRPRHVRGGFHRRRLRRLLQPTMVFLGVWVLIEVALHGLGGGGQGLIRGMRIGYVTPFESLWFLGVYLVLVVLSPATIRLHLRLGAAVPVAMLALVMFVDVLSLATGRRQIELVNIPLVWLFPHQLGYFYADGSLKRMRRSHLLAIALSALVVTGLLTGLPFYGRNLLDTGVTIFGITAPNLPFDTMCIAVVAGALAARPTLLRWLAKVRSWALVNRVNSVIMTVFLWHMTAFFAVLVALYELQFPLPTRPDATWWLERPVFLVLPAAALVLLVWFFARFEGTSASRRTQAS